MNNLTRWRIELARDRRSLAVLWSCFVVIASIVPIKFRHTGSPGRFHEAAHIIAFLTTVLVFSRCANSRTARLIYSGWTLFLAFATEWLETAVYHNRFEWRDVGLDLAGVALGCLLVAVRLTSVQRVHLGGERF
jgi:hypothetical protein